jgi:hypothetical protein
VSLNIDWRRVFATPTPEIVRTQKVTGDAGAGTLWSTDPPEILELSAYGAMAWQGRDAKPSGPRYEWSGFNLLCNAAPAPIVLNGEGFSSVDSFYQAIQIPEGTPERAACAVAPLHDGQRLARRHRAGALSYRGERIAVGSAEHEGLLAAAISAKVDQNPDVQVALRETGFARLIFPSNGSGEPGVLARVTPLALMLERWKRWPPAR